MTFIAWKPGHLITFLVLLFVFVCFYLLGLLVELGSRHACGKRKLVVVISVVVTDTGSKQARY